MFFRFWRRRNPTEKRWLELAKRLGLERVDNGEELLQDLLDLPAGARLGPVLELNSAGTARAYLFYYLQPTDERSRRLPCITGCLLVSQDRISPVSWRAIRKVHNVISSLQASATGGQVTLVPGADEFNEKVTVVAREEREVVELLRPPVRTVLERAIQRVEPPPTLTVAERRVLLTAAGNEVAHGDAEFLLSDVLSLYAALESVGD